MKTVLLLLFSAIAIASVAQQNNDIPISKTGNSVKDRLSADLHKRVPETSSIPLTWHPVPFGYYTNYTVENTDYMVVYDKNGNHKETLEKRAWDDRTPEILRLEFGHSPYATFTIITFWEALQTYNKDFFFEFQDKEGKTHFAWSDENGKFSDQPAFLR